MSLPVTAVQHETKDGAHDLAAHSSSPHEVHVSVRVESEDKAGQAASESTKQGKRIVHPGPSSLSRALYSCAFAAAHKRTWVNPIEESYLTVSKFGLAGNYATILGQLSPNVGEILTITLFGWLASIRV